MVARIAVHLLPSGRHWGLPLRYKTLGQKQFYFFLPPVWQQPVHPLEEEAAAGEVAHELWAQVFSPPCPCRRLAEGYS
ncbi:hypothetical protein KAR10_05750, partial [bacterium]|nr:hypothetical protein [bacterium]